MTQPAGAGATVDFRFRNGRRVHFEAHEILVDKLLSDVKEYIASRPHAARLADRSTSTTSACGWSPLNQQQYLGAGSWPAGTSTWSRLPGHFDRQVTVTTPLQKAGAYLLTARMDGGNTSYIVVWLDDTVIVKKPLAEKAYYFVADSRTGQPVARRRRRALRLADVPGRGQERVPHRDEDLDAEDRRRTARSSLPTDDLADPRGYYQWLVTARTAEGRFAHLGFSNIWHRPAL